MTTSITLRATKGSALTHDEMDTNLTNLQTTADDALAATETLTADKAEAAALGVANTDQNMGSYTGVTIPDNETAKQNIQSLETALEVVDDNLDDAVLAVGVALGAQNMGTYTGSTISDNQTAKQNIQELETAAELRLPRFADRTALAAVSTTLAAVYDAAFLWESGREGVFVWSADDNSANITADPGQGVYVPPTSDTTGASGAWVRKFVGYASIKWFGAVMDGATDDATAIQRCFNYCRDYGQEWIIPDGDAYYTGQVICYTGGVCIGELLIPNNGASDNAFLVAPVAADITTINAATVDGWGFHTKGVSEHADAATYAGKVVWWYTTDELAIDRFGSTGLSIQESIIVAEGGKFYPPISYTKALTWTTVEAKAVTIREPITIHGLKMRSSTGAVECEGFIEVTRPNVIFEGGYINNDTATAIRTGINFYETGAMGRVVNFDVADLLDNATNYAYHAGSSDLTLVGCTERNCRRGFDGQSSKRASIIGGSYPDGIGGHWHHDLHVSGGAYISCDDSNSAALLYAGSDLTVTGCRIRIPTEITQVYATRGDLYEHFGSLRIEDCDIDIDVSTNLSTVRTILRLAEGSTTDGADWGRLVYLPSHISFKNNRVRQIGASYTARTTIASWGSSKTFVDGLSAGGRIEVSGNTWDFDGGDASYLLAFTAYKDALWTDGDGYEIVLEDIPSLQVYNFCATARTDDDQRNNYVIDANTLILQLSPGAWQFVQYNSRTPTVTPITSGRTTLSADEVQARIGPVRAATTTWNIGSTAAGATVTTTITVNGAGAGMLAQVGLDNIATSSLAAGWILTAQVTAANTVTISAYNGTGGVSDPTTMNLYVRVV